MELVCELQCLVYVCVTQTASFTQTAGKQDKLLRERETDLLSSERTVKIYTKQIFD